MARVPVTDGDGLEHHLGPEVGGCRAQPPLVGDRRTVGEDDVEVQVGGMRAEHLEVVARGRSPRSRRAAGAG